RVPRFINTYHASTEDSQAAHASCCDYREAVADSPTPSSPQSADFAGNLLDATPLITRCPNDVRRSARHPRVECERPLCLPPIAASAKREAGNGSTPAVEANPSAAGPIGVVSRRRSTFQWADSQY